MKSGKRMNGGAVIFSRCLRRLRLTPSSGFDCRLSTRKAAVLHCHSSCLFQPSLQSSSSGLRLLRLCWYFPAFSSTVELYPISFFYSSSRSPSLDLFPALLFLLTWDSSCGERFIAGDIVGCFSSLAFGLRALCFVSFWRRTASTRFSSSLCKYLFAAGWWYLGGVYADSLGQAAVV